MKPLSKEEKEATLDSFSVYVSKPELETVDRSTAERWEICPMQASLVDAGKQGPLPEIVDTGELVHLAFSAGIKEWIESQCECGPLGIREAVEQSLRGCRPDLQPNAIAAARGSIWQFAAFLCEINLTNIHAFDGGESLGKSGQLAWDFPGAGVRYTSEIDFLWQGHSPDVLCEEDWKSGWKKHWPEDVYQDFQFQSHAVLVLNNYDKAKALDVTIWDVRSGRKAYPVRFERKYLGQYTARIYAALQSRHDHQDNPVPWPVAEKCRVCPVARHCSASGDIGEIEKDRAGALREFIALDAKHSAFSKLLSASVKAHGMIEADGCRFATEHASPPRTQLLKPKAKGAKKGESTESESE